MTGVKCIEILSNPGSVKLQDIPVLDYPEFIKQTVSLLHKENYHCLNYFAYKTENRITFYILVANDDSHKILVYSHSQDAGVKELESMTHQSFQLHVFERSIREQYGITFTDHPWLKPLRYPFDRADQSDIIPKYPFYSIESDETHEVGVGPIHAGIIEPGHFRFQCYGEKVLHLEIQLGYQHRGITQLMVKNRNQLKRSLIAENIAGDTTIGHALAFAQLSESLCGKEPPDILKTERIIALEFERLAIHIGDLAALCGDIAYQRGQVYFEALRTIVINTLQDWCGNRFGKGLIRASGTNYPLSGEKEMIIQKMMDEVRKRFTDIASLVFNDSGVVARFENAGTVSARQAFLVGAVGMAARASGIHRDIRKSHPFQAYKDLKYNIPGAEGGDVYARAQLRKAEALLSIDIIEELISRHSVLEHADTMPPDYNPAFTPEILSVSLTEGWRGEICHSAITGTEGSVMNYEIKDPSLHNWHLLALAMRNQEISDFPVCNKSFNLSYCGNDL